MQKLFTLFFFLIFSACLAAQTNVPGGLVTGTWTTAGSPYMVQGNLLIANGTMLTIQPGVTVNFQGSYKLLVAGRLVAAGTSTDSIRFTSSSPNIGWQGIKFSNTSSTNDSSKISYCSLEYGYVNETDGAGIYASNFSKLSITHNRISNCMAQSGKGAVYLESSSAIVTNNSILYNHSIAGALFINGGNPLITDNIISYNDNEQPPVIGAPGIDPDNFGAGLSLYECSATVTNNIITYNNSRLHGGGLVSSGAESHSIITYNTITHNQCANSGGGVYCRDNMQLFSNNLVAYNYAGVSGGGAFYIAMSGNQQFTNNKMIYNVAATSGGGIGCYSVPGYFSNNLIANNSTTAAGTTYDGGGGLLLIACDTNTVISGNIIVNNTSINGGGILCYAIGPKLVNNTLVNNSAARGGGVYCNSCNPVLRNMLLRGNTASEAGQQIFLIDDQSDPSVTYSDVTGGMAAINANGNFYTGLYQNNIDANPLFVAPTTGSGTGFDGTAANWALQNTSPAINAGQPGNVYTAVDYAGNIRVINGIVDMGAIENQMAAPPTVTVSGGGQSCIGGTLPPVIFTFTYGTLPFTLKYSINGGAAVTVTNINDLQYIIPHAEPGTYTATSVSDALTTGTSIGYASVTEIHPVAKFTVNDTAQCLEANLFTFTNTSTINSGTFTCVWDFGDGSPTSTATSPSHVYPAPANYSVKLIITSNNGCADTISRTITVAKLSINTLADTVRTYQDSIILNAGDGFDSYHWSTGAVTQSITVKNNGLYKVTVTNSEGCPAKDSSYVDLRKNKTLTIDAKENLCSVSSFSLPVRTKNITNVIGLQGTINWNASLMALDSIVYNNSMINIRPADLNVDNKADGYITYSWSDNTLAGKSAADRTVLFSMRFSKINPSAAATLPVSFSSSHTALEIDTINLSTHAPVTAIETAYVNGSAGFRQGASAANVVLESCDSVIFKNNTYFNDSVVYDTLQYAGTACDSIYKIVYIKVYHFASPAITVSSSPTDIINGNSVAFNASITYGGTAPLIQWYKNGSPITGENGLAYSSTTLKGGDTIYAVLKSSLSCTGSDLVISNKTGINVRYAVGGSIRTFSGSGVRQTVIDIAGYSGSSFTASASGDYSAFLYGGPAHNYVVKPSKANDVNETNGVSTLDIAMIQSHILNAVPFSSPYQWIAADVNKSRSVTSIDILFIKRLILGLDNSFTGNRLWAFVDTANGGLNTLQPLQYRDSTVITNLLSDNTQINFTGVKLGDVNFDYNPALARPSLPATAPVNFYYNDVKVKEAEEIRIPVRVKNFRDVLGLQFTLNFNADVLQLKNIEKNRLNMQYAVNRSQDGKIPFIWNDENNVLSNLNDGDILMELVFTAKKPFAEEDIAITPDIAAIELWDGSYKKHAIIKADGRIISYELGYTAAQSFEVMPNPTTGIVLVSFQMPKEKNLQLDLLNTAGAVIYTQKIKAAKGLNTIHLNLQRDHKLTTGTYSLKLRGIENDPIKKVLLVK